MACGLLHSPDILFLDEPTSGADPLARRDFWLRINSLAEKGVTIIITTHFLGEAEFCDNMLIMMDGTTLAEGSPDEIRQYAPPREDGAPGLPGRRLPDHHGRTHAEGRGRIMKASLKRIGALIVKELHQVVRDPGNIGIAVILPAVLLLLFGYGMSMDIKNVRIAYLAVPASSESTNLETRLTLSRYFQTTRVFSSREAEEKLRTHQADAFIALQSNAPDTLNGGVTKVQIVVNGVNANQATLIRNYLQAVVGSWAASLSGGAAPCWTCRRAPASMKPTTATTTWFPASSSPS